MWLSFKSLKLYFFIYLQTPKFVLIIEDLADIVDVKI